MTISTETIALDLNAETLQRLDALIATQGRPAPSRADAIRDIVISTLTLVESTSLMRQASAPSVRRGKRIVDRAVFDARA